MADNERMDWVEREGIAKARVAGVAEVAAAAAFIGTATGVLESHVLAGIAAIGIVVVMALAAATVHAPHDEPVVTNVVLGALALVLAVGAFTT